MDDVGPPQRIRWYNTPNHGRAKNLAPQVTSMVTAGGVIFTAVDRATSENVHAAAEYTLVARDAFNGIELWTKPLLKWETEAGGSIKSIPTSIRKLLIAKGEYIYCPLGHDEAIVELIGKTGELSKTFKSTKKTKEMSLSNGMLYGIKAPAGKTVSAKEVDRDRRSKAPQKGSDASIDPKSVSELYALDVKTGQLQWAHNLTTGYTAATLSVKGGYLVISTPKEIVCLNSGSGKVEWRKTYAIAEEIPKAVKKEKDLKKEEEAWI